MELPTCQEKVLDLPTDTLPVRIAFNNARKFFAVDASGSTSGGIMRAQEKAVRALHGNPNDNVVLWDHECGDPCCLDRVDPYYFRSNGGTRPACIMEKPSAVDQI